MRSGISFSAFPAAKIGAIWWLIRLGTHKFSKMRGRSLLSFLQLPRLQMAERQNLQRLICEAVGITRGRIFGLFFEVVAPLGHLADPSGARAANMATNYIYKIRQMEAFLAPFGCLGAPMLGLHKPFLATTIQFRAGISSALFCPFPLTRTRPVAACGSRAARRRGGALPPSIARSLRT